MQGTGCPAIEIRNVTTGNRPKPHQIEVSVPELQRIKRPFDQFYSARNGVLTLREFQQPANASVLVSGHHADHVRMKIDRSLVYRCECQREPDRLVLIVREQ